MKAEVRLFATFRENRQKKIFMEISEGDSVTDILDTLGISVSEVAILLINGRDAETAYVLKDNDIVSLFPPVGGG